MAGHGFAVILADSSLQTPDLKSLRKSAEIRANP
jgi:hypothetical protein